MIGVEVTESPPVSFAALLRKSRLDAGLTQEKLAESAKISYRSISDLERGINRGPRADTLRLLADALGLTGDVRAAFEAAGRQHITTTEQAAGWTAGQRPSHGIAAATRTLPRDVASFTGRHPEIESLLDTGPGDAAAGSVVEICAIGGMAGVGKTALAVHVAHRLADRFPDGQVFLQLHGHTPGQRPVDPADALASLLQASGIPSPQIPDGLEPRAWLWRDHLVGKRVLLLLDDAAGHEQIRPLLPGSPGTLVLITSRRHLTALEDARVISLDMLPPDDAAALLVRLAARPGLDPASDAIGEIARLCGYLPLAIGMLARQLHHHPSWTAADLAAELSTTRDRLGLMRAENLSVAAAFDLSYRDLPFEEQRLFGSLGVHPGTDFDDYAAAAIADADLASTRRQISNLYDHYLLSEPARGRYRMHDLIAEYARMLAAREPAAHRDAAIDRLLGYYLHTTRIAGRQLTRRTPAGPAVITGSPPAHWPEFSAQSDATAWLDAEHVNLRAAVSYAASHAQAGYAIEIPAAMHGYLRHHGNWPQVLALHEIAIGTARRIGNPQAEANALTDAGDIHYLLGDYTAAASRLIPAITIHRRAGNGLGLAHALTILGYVGYLSGENSAAHDSLNDALDRYRRLGDKLGEVGTLAYLGRVHLAAGNYPAAKAVLNQALDSYRGLGGIMEASLYYYLGVAQEATGDYQAATASITQALQLQRDAGNPHGQMEALTYLALAQHNSGDLEAAEASLEDAKQLSRNLGIHRGHDLGLWPLDHVRYRVPENSLSTASLRYAVDMYAKLGLRRDEAAALKSLGERALLSGDLLDAYAYYQRAFLIAREIRSLPAEADALEGAGRCLLRLGKPEVAAMRLRRALAVYERMGSPRAETIRATFGDLLPTAELRRRGLRQWAGGEAVGCRRGRRRA
jgi:tetratricopeptide (TPR) repeat protein/transcriptional regulator with XRE-family HTH domain